MYAFFVLYLLKKIMELNVKNLNRYLFFKLPSAYWSGVRVSSITDERCEVRVRHKWINQNPFKSMYFAVQAMAAELTTGALVMRSIQQSGKKVSMLVLNNTSAFTKKATGTITFVCEEGNVIQQTIQKAIETGEGQTIWVTSTGENENGEQVSKMKFEWTIKAK